MKRDFWLAPMTKGEWWLPHSPDRKLAGFIIETDGELALELVGSFVEVPEFAEYPLIHGSLTNGVNVSLFSCIGSLEWSLRGPSSERCSFSRAIKWYEMAPDTTSRFSALGGRNPSLRRWIKRSGLHIDRQSGNQPKKWIATYEYPEPIRFAWGVDHDVSLFATTTLPFGTRSAIQLEEDYSFQVETNREASFQELYKTAYDVRLFVELLSGIKSQESIVHCTLAGCKEEPALDVFINRGVQQNPAADTDVRAQPLFFFEDVEHSVTDLAHGWLALLSKHEDAVYAYFAGKSAPRFEDRLLAYSGALQSFAEVKAGKTLPFKAAVADFIERYCSNERSVEVIQLLENSRHYYAHHNPIRREAAARGATLVNLTELMEATVACSFLEEIGMTVGQIWTAVGRNRDFEAKFSMRSWSDIESA